MPTAAVATSLRSIVAAAHTAATAPSRWDAIPAAPSDPMSPPGTSTDATRSSPPTVATIRRKVLPPPSRPSTYAPREGALTTYRDVLRARGRVAARDRWRGLTCAP